MKRATIYFTDSKQLKKLGDASVTRAVKNMGDSSSVEVTHVNDDGDSVYVVKQDFKTAQDARDFGGKMYSKFSSCEEIIFETSGQWNNDIYEGAMLASYTFDRYKSSTPKPKATVTIKETATGSIHESVNMARDLITEPGNKLYPEKYAYRVNDMLSKMGVTVKVYHQKQLETMGLDLLLSVGQGSVNDSYVVVMEWMKGKEGDQPIALVGKGVTFDTGGISIKPSAGMGDMKFDMGGSAAVVGAMHAIASHDLKQNVVGIIGLVENMPDGNSIKPGDVVQSLSGKHVENLNTDAEGRLVLADILTYVQAFYDPHTIIDLATLTGAILVSLGNDIAGLFTNSSELSNTIDAVGKSSGEDFWRMPMGKAWRDMLDSDIADIKNIGGGRYGGSTTAAEFLYEFIDEGRAWAHLDIAGTVWSESGKPTSPKGAVGFGVRTLFNLVANESGRTFEIDEDMKY